MPKRMAYKRIARQVDENLDAENASRLIINLADILWGNQSPSEWSPDTIEAVANLLNDYGIGPDCEE